MKIWKPYVKCWPILRENHTLILRSIHYNNLILGFYLWYKEIVSVITSNPQRKDENARFTTGLALLD